MNRIEQYIRSVLVQKRLLEQHLIEDDKPKDLQRWFKEQWTDIGNQDYPVFRPTKIISKDTPLIASEIKPSNLKKQIKLKQIIKGKKNLPKFIAR